MLIRIENLPETKLVWERAEDESCRYSPVDANAEEEIWIPIKAIQEV